MEKYGLFLEKNEWNAYLKRFSPISLVWEIWVFLIWRYGWKSKY